MNIDELPKLAADLKEKFAQVENLNGAFLEIGTALADILALLEKQGPDTAQAIAGALKGISLSLQAPSINVSPTPVEVRVDAPPMPAPVIHLMEREQKGGWKVTFENGPYGEIKGMTLKPI